MNELLLTSELTADGWTSAAIRRAHREGQLVHVRHGVWALSSTGDSRSEYCRRGLAALRVSGPGSVLSHLSAAAHWELPLPAGPVGPAWVTRDIRCGGHIGHDVHLVLAPLEADEVTEVDGIPVTSLARTVVDVARSQDFLLGVMVADAALRRGCGRRELQGAISRATRWPGNARARRVVAVADPRAESPYESRVRVLLIQMGLHPVPQLVLRDGSGRFVARVDFALEEVRLVLEFDGEQKYDEMVGARGVNPQEVFAAEKTRDMDIRTLGWTVEHLTKTDVHDVDRFRRKVTRAVALARRNQQSPWPRSA